MPSVPSTTWQMLEQKLSGKSLPKGLDAAWDRGAGLLKRCTPRTRTFLKRAEKVLSLEEYFAGLSDSRLREAGDELRSVFRRGRETSEDVERSFALVREVAYRRIGERPFGVQVAGAFALEAGCIAEMATGEGKTLTSTMPATIAGWRGGGCHVITVNDYLAKRDAQWMGDIYKFCGLRVGHVEQEMPAEQRREAYASDITYCTNKEVTADFLRDRLILGRLRGLSAALLAKLVRGRGQVTDRLVHRGLNCAIVDEADSVLIDEAVTPLIISGHGPNPEQIEAFREAAGIVEQMEADKDYKINRRYREVELTTAGRARIGQLSKELGGLWRGVRRSEEMVVQALTARELYHRDKHYVIDDGKVIIVDEFTGRLMPDRKWRAGLHQAVEAKEGVEVTPPNDTFARISFQRFFRMYRKLSGMTGTAREATSEFWQVYHLPVAVIPTNKPCIRKHLRDVVVASGAEKWRRIVGEIRRMHEIGRPVLVGTRSVKASEHLSGLLREEGMECQVLNAVQHRREAQIVAGAGREGKITVATNMAGRGTDIKLARGVAELGGLHVIATERHESGRIDRQLFGRAARQGDPGSAQAIVSLEDELVKRYAPGRAALARRSVERRSAKANGTPSAGRNGNGFFSSSVFRIAQRRAESIALRQRKAVLRSDHWLDEYLGFAGAEW